MAVLARGRGLGKPLSTTESLAFGEGGTFVVVVNIFKEQRIL